MLRRTRKVVGWTLSFLGFVFGIAKPIADWIGRSTLLEDASDFVRKMSPILEFLQRQPDLWFYGFQAALIAVGLTLVFWAQISRALWGGTESETPAIEPPKETQPILPKSVKELSKSDYSECLKISTPFEVVGARERADVHLCVNQQSHSKFLVIYLPHTEHALAAIRELADEAQPFLDRLSGGVRVLGQSPGDNFAVDFSTIPFVNRVVVYHDNTLSLQEMAQLEELYKSKGLALVLRGSNYATTQWLLARTKE